MSRPIPRPPFLGNGTTISPSLALDFTHSAPSDSRIAISRAGVGGTYFDATNTLQMAPPDTLRIDYGAVARGVTNWFFPSVANTTNAWGVPANSTLLTNTVAAPDGTITAALMIADASNSNHQLSPNVNNGAIFLLPNTAYTASMYVQAGTTSKCELHIRLATDWVGGVVSGRFDLGAVTAVCLTGNGTCTITPLAGNWFRITTTGVTTASPNMGFPIWIFLDDASGSGGFAGAGESMYLWGIQVEQGSVATALVPTTTAPVATLVAQGLLIESLRTNSVRNPRAEGSTVGTPGVMPANWSVAAATGMASQVVATGVEQGIPYIDLRLFGTPSTSASLVSTEAAGGITATVGQVWASSMYIRVIAGSIANVGPITLDLTETGGATITGATIVPDGTPLAQQRFANVVTTLTGTTSIAQRLRFGMTTSSPTDFTVRLGAPQLEVGGFSSSPILPVIGTPAAATRSGDAVTMPTTGWYAPTTPGSFYTEFQINQLTPAGISFGISSISDGTNNNVFRHRITASGSTQVSGDLDTASVTEAGLADSPWTVGGINKFISAWDSGHYIIALNGQAVVTTATAITVPVVNSLKLGTWGDGSTGTAISGWLRVVKVWNRTLAPTELVTVTT